MPSGAANKTAKSRARAASHSSTTVASSQTASLKTVKSGGSGSTPAAAAGGLPSGTAIPAARPSSTRATDSPAHDSSRCTSTTSSSTASGNTANTHTGSCTDCDDNWRSHSSATAAATQSAADATPTAAGLGRPRSDQSSREYSKTELDYSAQPASLHQPHADCVQQPISIFGRAVNSDGRALLQESAIMASQVSCMPATATGGGSAGARSNSKRKSVAAKMDLKTMPLQALLSLTSAPCGVEWTADAAGNPPASAQVDIF